MSRMLALACALAAFALAAGSASAQQPTGPSQPAPTPPYGPPITLEQAKRVMAAAELEAARNSWQVAIVILDSGGNMVMFHKARQHSACLNRRLRGQGQHGAAI